MKDDTGKSEQVVLVLQGGGALGAYQAGVYAALNANRLAPSWIAATSIGALNGALIAGNPPERRIERLRTFWDMVSARLLAEPPFPGDAARRIFNEASAAWTLTFGVPGFFVPRVPPAVFYPPGTQEALSIYDTSALGETLEGLVDFDLINDGPVRLSVGAVNIRTGNLVYFDNRRRRLGPEHIMASGALPPGFPPVEIDGEAYWDGGVVSNAPLQYVLDDEPRQDMVVFQVDLFSARGLMPQTLSEVVEREKEIRYSSRTRLNTDAGRRLLNLRCALGRFLKRLPEELQSDPDFLLLDEFTAETSVTIMHLIHRQKNYHTQSKDYEFSRHSLEEHWQAGTHDVARSLRHPEWRDRAKPESGVVVFDLTRDARD